MNEMETATIKARLKAEQNYAWRWLLDRLADYVQMRGCRPEDDEALKRLFDEFYVEAHFLLDPTGDDIGPTADILSAFRETPALWLEACPSDHVVVVPRGILKNLLAALPVSADGLGALATPTVEMMEHYGAAFLAEGAYHHKRARDARERAGADRAKEIIDRVLAGQPTVSSTAPSSDERQHAIQQAAEFPAEIADDADRQPLADKR